MKRKAREGSAYTEEFKAEAVNVVLCSDRSVNSIAKELGIGESTLRYWLGTKKTAKGTDMTLPERVKYLEKQNRRLKMEQEILKKAAAFFAKNVL